MEIFITILFFIFCAIISAKDEKKYFERLAKFLDDREHKKK